MCSNNQEVLKTLDLSPQKVMKIPMHLNPNKTPRSGSDLLGVWYLVYL